MIGLETAARGRVVVIRWTEKPTVELVQAARQFIDDAWKLSGEQAIYYLGVVTTTRIPDGDARRALRDFASWLPQRCAKVRYALELDSIFVTMVRTIIEGLSMLAGSRTQRIFAFSKTSQLALAEFAIELRVDPGSLASLAAPREAARAS